MRIFMLGVVWLLLGSLGSHAASIGGYTNLSYSPVHGTQIEYVANGGSNYLWYPGNAVILPGHWKAKGKDICFKYGANTYNPATGSAGAKWECMPLDLHKFSVKERAVGDPFGLAKRTAVPFVLSKFKSSLSAVAKRLGVPITLAALPETRLKTRFGVVTGIPEDTTQMPCERLLAMRHKSRANEIYFAGMMTYGNQMGSRCKIVDTVGAFEIFKKFGVVEEHQYIIERVQARAAAGSAYAKSELRKLKAAGFVD